MSRRRLLIACGVLIVRAAAPFAQSSGSTDPISGTWTGDMAPRNATSRASVTVEMKFDGQAISGSVTGPTLTPGVIKGGTFNPKTGALRFDVHVINGNNASVFVFDGTVTNGTAAGRVTSDNQTGDFKITRK